MKRYTMTPQPRKSVKLPSSTIKPTPFPRMSMSTDDVVQKEARNARDKAYRASCVENIIKFFSENNYDGAYSQKVLNSPSNKEFQSMFKFIYSFIDPTPFSRFEDDVLSILKLVKYPYSSEITRSQLAAVTPHTWPVVLSMMSWMVDLVRKADDGDCQAATVETEFFGFVCEGYVRFMEGVEDDGELEEQFMGRVSVMHSKEAEEIENRRRETELLRNELENLNSKFDDLARLEARKKKVNEDLNALIANDRQLEAKKSKYVSSIEKLMEEVAALEHQIDDLIKTKNDLVAQINSQTINPQDIKEMNVEKVELFKELERLKPEREALTKALKAMENKVCEKVDDVEKLLSELTSQRKGLSIEKDVLELKSIDHAIAADLESQLSSARESIVNYEMTASVLDERISDKESQFRDLEEQYNHLSAKLQTIGSIYLEKKEISERSQQKNRSEMDRLEHELLRLKLESDSIYLKSEKDYSEAKIKLDILNSHIAREREEINRLVWDFYNSADTVLKSMELLERDVKRLLKRT